MEYFMKCRHFLFGLFITLLVTQTFAQSSSWDLYEPRTMNEIKTIAAKSIENPDVVIDVNKEDVSIILSYNSYQSKVKAVYTGTSRKASEQNKEVISFWLKTLGKPKEYLEMFEDDYLFTESGVEYWLPVQKQVASYFGEELQKGDPVTLYVVWLGARKVAADVDYIFLVNEFEAEESP